MKWVVLLLVVAGAVAACSTEGASGHERSCPGAKSSTFLDRGEDDPGARTAALAAEPFLDSVDRVVREGGPEAVTFRVYDADDRLVKVVDTVQSGGEWYTHQVDACE